MLTGKWVSSQLLHIFLTISFIACVHTGNAQDSAVVQAAINFDSLRAAKARESIGLPFPSFAAKLHHQPYSNADLKGKVVFINFWFAACPPCVAEMNSIRELALKYRNHPEVIFLSFTYENEAAIAKFRAQHPMPYRVLSVSRYDCYRLNQNNAFPTSIILDKNGIIRFLVTGGVMNKQEAAAYFKKTVTAELEKVIRQ